MKYSTKGCRHWSAVLWHTEVEEGWRVDLLAQCQICLRWVNSVRCVSAACWCWAKEEAVVSSMEGEQCWWERLYLCTSSCPKSSNRRINQRQQSSRKLDRTLPAFNILHVCPRLTSSPSSGVTSTTRSRQNKLTDSQWTVVAGVAGTQSVGMD